jgi:UDP-N-acetyl-D-galactosamine dehydrogenase
VADVVVALQGYGVDVTVYDPYASAEEVQREYDIHLHSGSVETIITQQFDAVILAVAHSSFRQLDIEKMLATKGFVYDVKGFLEKYDGRL